MSTKPNNKKQAQGKTESKKVRRDLVDERPVKETKEKGKKYNDPAWRMYDKVLTEQVNTYSFEPAIGVPMHVTSRGKDSDGTSAGTAQVSIQTACVFDMLPSPGDTPMNAPNLSAINQQALRTYTMLSGKNAKTTQYQPNDIAIIILALGDVISAFSHARRVLGLARLYNVRNRTFPKEAIRMLGFDPDDMLANLAQYRITYNALAVMASKIPFPGNIDYFKNCDALYSDIFLDEADNPMAQWYAFRPLGLWEFDEAYNDKGSGLHMRTDYIGTPGTFDPGKKITLATYFTRLETMIQALLTSSTLNYVYADVVRYCTENGAPIWGITQLDSDYVTMPTYSEEALMQIHNMSMVYIDGAMPQTFDAQSDVDTNSVIWRPAVFDCTNALATDHILDFPRQNPTIEEKVTAMRFVVAWDDSTQFAGTDKNHPHKWSPVMQGHMSIPDHFCVGCYVYKDSGSNGVRINTLGGWETTGAPWQGPLASPMFAEFAPFRNAPIVYSMLGNTGNGRSLVRPLGELNYYTTIDYDKIKNVHEIAYYALFELR